MDDLKLEELSEKIIVHEIKKVLEVSDLLVDGFGHDSGFVDTTICEDELLLMNTDRSSINVAYTLGLSNGECVGALGISHAVSDIIASGGEPIAITVALLLPPTLTMGFVKEVMNGAQSAAKRYGAFLAAGDTKKNLKFAMVVTVVGKSKKEERLTRSNAKEDDLLVVTGNLGTMISGLISFKNKFKLSKESKKIFEDALIYQHPPYQLGTSISKEKVATSCTDISDGLASSIYDLCNESSVGAIIEEASIPFHTETLNLADKLNIRPFQLTLSGGDWQYLYTIPKENIEKVYEIARSFNTSVFIIGKITGNRDVLIKTLENELRIINRIENDKFSRANGGNYFNMLEKKVNIFGEKIE